MAVESVGAQQPARVAFYNDPKIRSIAYQAALCVLVVLVIYAATSNALDNLQRAHVASGLGFWNQAAGFDISQTQIEYSASVSTYGTAFWVGLLNTLLVGVLGIILATIIGFTVGISRLSKNWLLSKVATGYVETIRNIPLLLQLLFWYNAVLKALPDIRDSHTYFGSYLNNRGLYVPEPLGDPGFGFVEGAFGVGIVIALAFYYWARKRQMATGQQAPVALVSIMLVIGLPLAVFLALGMPLHFNSPQLGRFNLTGGLALQPEFVALLLGLC